MKKIFIEPTVHIKTSPTVHLPTEPLVQLELEINRNHESDRNYHLGGRSFYFFDFDDNIAFLSTSLVLFHKQTGAELSISSREWAQVHSSIGKTGFYQDYEIRFDDKAGTFRFFRDQEIQDLENLGHKEQIFVQDILELLGIPDVQWKGPSWETFYHATFNQRPISLITARGHCPETIKRGIYLFVQKKFLPMEPNYLSLYPVSHHQTRLTLGDHEMKMNTAELKQRAIRSSVEKAIQIYGYNDHHRFGMSDDDPKNLQLIYEELLKLKKTYPMMSFFMIETHNGNFVKHEVGISGTISEIMLSNQMSLFETHSLKS